MARPTDYANAADLAAMAAEIGFGPKDADKLRKGVVDDEEIAGFLERVAGIRRAALEEAACVAENFAAAMNAMRNHPDPLVIASRDGREILRLASDGTLTLDVKDADEAAKIFIECVSYQMAAHGDNGLGLPALLDAAAREARAAAIEECAKEVEARKAYWGDHPHFAVSANDISKAILALTNGEMPLQIEHRGLVMDDQKPPLAVGYFFMGLTVMMALWLILRVFS